MNIHDITRKIRAFAEELEAEAEAKPDPYAELKEAHAAGKVIQIKLFLSDVWTTFSGNFDNLDSRHELRIKPEAPPFTLPTPPPGVQWHREDGWTADMLPPGKRPLVKGEVRLPGDSIFPTDGSDSWRNKWQTVEREGWYHPQNPCNEKSYHSRTTRPLTFEHEVKTWTWHRSGEKCPRVEKRAVQVLLSDGSVNRDPAMPEFWDWEGESPDEVKIIGWRYADKNPHPKTCGRLDCKVTVTHYEVAHPKCSANDGVPKPKVPLGPEDVPPGSVLRRISWHQEWLSVSQMTAAFIVVLGNEEHIIFEDMVSEYEINRSIPLTGRWNPDAWEPCHKEAKK